MLDFSIKAAESPAGEATVGIASDKSQVDTLLTVLYSVPELF